MQNILKFIIAGSVDDGKSTLGGRLLYDLGALKIEEQNELKMPSGELDFSRANDGLFFEQQGGITIDLAWRFFEHNGQKFAMIDAPGHLQYTANMASGASFADVCVLLIDARVGFLEQSLRHLLICAIFGVKNFAILVNKMDLVDFSQSRFNEICKDFKKATKDLQNNLNKEEINLEFFPICAINGDNIVHKSPNTPWFKGPCFYDFLSFNIESKNIESNLNKSGVLLVQYINRAESDFRGICGLVLGGEIKIGDFIFSLKSKAKGRIKKIIRSKNLRLFDFVRLENTEETTLDKNKSSVDFECAKIGENITLFLENELDISRGDVLLCGDLTEISFLDSISIESKNIESTNLAKTYRVSSHFVADIVFLKEPKSINYILQCGCDSVSASICKVLNKFEINDLRLKLNPTKDSIKEISANDLMRVEIALQNEICACEYSQNRDLGGFILIEKYSNEIIAAGVILEFLSNLKPQKSAKDEIFELLEQVCFDFSTQNKIAFLEKISKLKSIIKEL